MQKECLSTIIGLSKLDICTEFVQDGMTRATNPNSLASLFTIEPFLNSLFFVGRSRNKMMKRKGELAVA